MKYINTIAIHLQWYKTKEYYHTHPPKGVVT
jgi:hypothetical protein